jgi:serine/threonine protein kinase
MTQFTEDEQKKLLESRGGWIPVSELGVGGGARVFKVIHIQTVNRLNAAIHPPSPDTVHARNRAVENAVLIDELATGEVKLFAAAKVSLKKDHRMVREIRTLQDVKHPNLIKLIAHDESNEPDWYVMELMPGGTLKSEASRFKGDTLAVLRGLEHVSAALAALHSHRQPIVHRDIKPANIFLRKDGEWVLGDPGVAYRDDDGDETNTRIGSKDWLPRWYDDEYSQTPRADLYMLGLVGFYLLSGENKPLDPTYVTREKFDLPKRFPDQPGIASVYELLKSLVVADPAMLPYENASQLHKAVSDLRRDLAGETTSQPRHLFSYSAHSENSGDVRALSEVPLWVPPTHDHLAVWLQADYLFALNIWVADDHKQSFVSPALAAGTCTVVPVPKQFRGRWLKAAVMRTGTYGNGMIQSMSIFAATTRAGNVI